MEEYELQTNILLQARDFYEAFNRCIEGKNQHIDENGRSVSSVVNIPAIVNGAFACELYFNCLTPCYLRSHSLLFLYSFINKDIRKQIEEQTISQIHSISQYKDFSFEDVLRDIDNSFVEWRYIFKKEHTDAFYGNRINRYIPLLSILLKSLSVVALEHYKEHENNNSNNLITFYVQHFKYLINKEKREMLSEKLITHFAYKSIIPNDNCEQEVLYLKELKDISNARRITNRSRFDLKCNEIAFEFKYHIKLKTSSSATTTNYNSVIADIERLSNLASIGKDCYFIYVYDNEMKRIFGKRELPSSIDEISINKVLDTFTLSNDLFLSIIRIFKCNASKRLKIEI